MVWTARVDPPPLPLILWQPDSAQVGLTSQSVKAKAASTATHLVILLPRMRVLLCENVCLTCINAQTPRVLTHHSTESSRLSP